MTTLAILPAHSGGLRSYHAPRTLASVGLVAALAVHVALALALDHGVARVSGTGPRQAGPAPAMIWLNLPGASAARPAGPAASGPGPLATVPFAPSLSPPDPALAKVGLPAEVLASASYVAATSLDAPPAPETTPDLNSVIAAARDGGAVRLRVYVSRKGPPDRIELLDVPGDASLARALRDLFGRTDFIMGLKDGQQVAAYIDYEFTIDRRVRPLAAG